MANRKSWRRPAGPPSGRGPSRLSQKPASASFAGVSSAGISSMLHVLLAKDVTLATVDGVTHTGLFAGTEHAPDGTRLVLNYASSTGQKGGKTLGSATEKRGDVARKLSINVKDVVTMTAAGAMNAVGKTDSVAGAAGVKGGFSTDSEITRGAGGVGRQLQRFDDFTELRSGEGVKGGSTLDEQTFGDMANGRPVKKWDQFQANETKFGVKTSFDEGEYTTKINTRDAKFAERQREAARLASEIESKQSDNVHIRVERNQEIARGLDEEALHSGVQRPVMQKPVMQKPGKPLAKTAETAKEGKPAPAERPKLSYAAAAAGSVKAQPVAPAQTPASAPVAAAKVAPVAGRAAPSVPSTSATLVTSTSTSSENKERDSVVKKKPKSNGPRSSRENLQLAKVRSAISGRNSPSQSRNSPLPTPATADTSAVAVLNLDAQTPNLGPEQIKSFEEYKTNREFRSMAENREKITDDLKKFRTQLDSRNGPLRRSNSSANGSGSNNSTTATEKKPSESSAKSDENPTTAKPMEAKVDQGKEAEATPSKTPETLSKPKSKPKSKLNPNAAEFRFNPDAPSFSATGPKQTPMSHPAQNFLPYPVGGVPPEYSQPVQPGHQSYPVPMQAMGQIPYGQPYGMIMPGAVPSGMAGGNSGYQFMQGPPGGFPPSQVPGRFPQSPGTPVSYGYPHLNPTIPMGMTQTPQRIPAGPYPFYNSGPYSGGQVPGGPQLSQPPQPQMYPPANQQGGVPHMQGGGMHVGGRGGHGHSRRGGGGRRGGKHHGQHSHTVTTNAPVNSTTDKGAQRPTENGVVSDVGQRVGQDPVLKE